ncbi:hypothetical protein LXL04_003610 [Taraxacum kok-saghyz]
MVTKVSFVSSPLLPGLFRLLTTAPHHLPSANRKSRQIQDPRFRSTKNDIEIVGLLKSLKAEMAMVGSRGRAVPMEFVRDCRLGKVNRSQDLLRTHIFPRTRELSNLCIYAKKKKKFRAYVHVLRFCFKNAQIPEIFYRSLYTTYLKEHDYDDSFVDPPPKQLRARFPPKCITDIVSGLNDNQKGCLKRIGVGSILKLQTENFSKSLADERPKNKKIKKTADLWKNQFPKEVTRPSLTQILQKQNETEEADDLFVLNFLVLFVNVIVQSTPMGEANKRLVRYIPSIEVVKDLDWCGIVMIFAIEQKSVGAKR